MSSLNLSILLRALAALLIGALTALTVWRSVHAARIVKAPGQLAFAARAVGWGLAAMLAGSAVLGFIAFATYLIKESLFAAAMGAALFLFDALVQASGDWLVTRWAPPARSGQPPGGPLTQTVVLGQGLVRLATIGFAMLLVLAPWGIQSTDMLGTLREAYQGVPVGGTVVSLASILAAAGMFAFVVFLSRTGRNWLAARYLPQTRLDAGLRNTISTFTGYVGVVVALALAGGQLGLDFQKVTIVAGALSVGIGFGLQAIVNNFVSGLILLLERGIRVGDFIVVGAEQGFVRRINARATEIETIERATLIVPNSLLVSAAVKNWMYADRVARIIVSVNVAYETDPEAAQALLIAAAKAQDLVMAIPAPLVLFHEFADWALKFQLICFVDDVMLAERVRSELNFDVLARMKDAGMRVPYPK